MSKIVTIFGGSGFVGRYIAQNMAKQGWRVRVAVRRPNEALYVKPYGTPGQVEPILCNIRDDDSVRAALLGVDAVVNCVGILNEIGKNSFEAIQHQGAARVARLATHSGVTALVHLSALGADENSASAYGRSKAEGEAAVLSEYPRAVILRPSAVFGAEDGFFNKFAGMTSFGPIVPVVGAKTLFQPVHVEDVAMAATKAVLGQVGPGVHELGGPDVRSLGLLFEDMLKVIERRRLVLPLPFWVGSIVAGIFDMVQGVTLGLVSNGILTRDQVKGLQVDNVVSERASGFADMGIEPRTMESVLPDYLWVYRPSGEFAAIKKSARNLDGQA